MASLDQRVRSARQDLLGGHAAAAAVYLWCCMAAEIALSSVLGKPPAAVAHPLSWMASLDPNPNPPSARQDLLGGHAAEAAVRIPRHNAVTGASFVWEQERFDPVTRHIFAYISLRDPASRQVLLPLAEMPVSAKWGARHVHIGFSIYNIKCRGTDDVFLAA